MPKLREKVESNQPQVDKFKAMAKELEADGDEKSFDRTLKKIGKAQALSKKSEN